eukprot:12355577-Alexandrium_andersonii.AAC.1
MSCGVSTRNTIAGVAGHAVLKVLALTAPWQEWPDTCAPALDQLHAIEGRLRAASDFVHLCDIRRGAALSP